jgi:ribonuclease HI
MDKVCDFMNYKIYCDGAASNNGFDNAIGGWAYVIIDENDNIVAEDSGRVPAATNNRMELYAAYAGLMAAMEQEGGDRCDIYTDSAYLHNCKDQNWYSNWIRNGWVNSKKQPVANKDLWMKLLPFFNASNIEFHKVKGHADDKWNEYVDDMAVAASKSGGEESD